MGAPDAQKGHINGNSVRVKNVIGRSQALESNIPSSSHTSTLGETTLGGG